MSIKQSLYLKFDAAVFNTDEASEARHLASESNGVLYCWKTSGNSNWLEKGLSLSDVLGIVVLPRGLPQQIDMPDDVELDD
jgi:hypothetical protein